MVIKIFQKFNKKSGALQIILLKKFLSINSKEQKVPKIIQEVNMTRQEVIEFFYKNFTCKKSDMRTIKDLQELADKKAYRLIKNGPDDYNLREKYAICNFTKPIKICRDIPPLAPWKCYNGVPVSLFTDSYEHISGDIWCYMMNKNDGDIIHFNDFINNNIERCNNIDDVVYAFDWMTNLGFLREQDNYIVFYAYPLNEAGCYIPSQYFDKRIPRMAPYTYID